MPKKEIQWKKTSQNPQRTKTTPIEFTFTPPTGASQIFVRELQAAALTALPSHQLWAKNQAKTETSRKTHPNFSWVSFHFLTSPNPTDDLSFPSWHLAPAVHPGAVHHHKKTWQMAPPINVTQCDCDWLTANADLEVTYRLTPFSRRKRMIKIYDDPW